LRVIQNICVCVCERERVYERAVRVAVPMKRIAIDFSADEWLKVN